MKIKLKSQEDLEIITKGGGKVIVPNNTDTSTDKTLATVDQIGPVGGDKANAASIAAPYETNHSSAYVVGDYVTHEGTLYKCNTDTSNPPGEWDDNNWDAVAVTDEMGGGDSGTKIWMATVTGNSTYRTATTTTGDFVFTNGALVLLTFTDAHNTTDMYNSSQLVVNIDNTGNAWCYINASDYLGGGIYAGQTCLFVCGHTANNTQKLQFVGKNYWRASSANGGTLGPTILSDSIDANSASNNSTKYYAASTRAVRSLAGVVNGKAPLDSPAFTGTPTAPDYGSSPATTSQVATIGYVDGRIGDIDSVLDAINGEVI